MKNYKLEIAYDGSRYYGWEHQKDRDTIQGKLEQVLEKMTGVLPDINGCGRTDAGVHAKEMIANVHLETDKTESEIKQYMNHYLPDDICVKNVSVASERFHARLNARGKLYTYTCYIGDNKPVFDKKYVTVLDFMPDIEKMRRAAEILQGEHDFKAFCTNPAKRKSTVRIVDSIEIVRNKEYLYLNFHGNGFLQNMVRILTGTLLEVGKGKMPAESMTEILEKQDRSLAGPTAPAKGLCLVKVDYA
ncbi:MAG: tRNA pseudouridine(38-40) synthase TruA [Lachnospiraceae bacterium]|nr:tRNA pseudouridine(38-40) synthase TruA [Lachnospiraceae bacterium]